MKKLILFLMFFALSCCCYAQNYMHSMDANVLYANDTLYFQQNNFAMTQNNIFVNGLEIGVYRCEYSKRDFDECWIYFTEYNTILIYSLDENESPCISMTHDGGETWFIYKKIKRYASIQSKG